MLSSLFNTIQTILFPLIEESYGKLTENEQRFVRVCEICIPANYTRYITGGYMGRPQKDRLAIVCAFIAKAIYNFATTKLLLEHLRCNPTLRRLCGWEGRNQIPSESTFSRAFAEISLSELPQKIHENMIKTHYKEKIVGHISRDATSISAREKPLRKLPKAKKVRRKRGRPKNGEVPQPKEPKKLEIQLNRTLQENLADIPVACDVGAKKDSKGYLLTWNGYKLHIDGGDGDVPLSALLSSASTHDSQVAIPLAQLSAQRVTNLYDLMDAAYDSKEIHEMSRRLNHVPVIDSNKRRGEKVEFDPAKKIRYNQRTASERINSNLKDNYGGRNVRVKGAKKVMAHLMFGIIALTAEQLFRLLQ